MVLTRCRWHEHDPLEIISSIEICIDSAVKAFEEKGHSARLIRAVGLTNQRETTVVWDTETGEPLYNAIVWTDTRTQGLVRKLKARLGSDRLQEICGLPLSTYPSVGKLLWMIENVPKVADAYSRGQLSFGTVDAWVIYRLNGGPKSNVFVTDPTNASRSMFMNLHTLKYDEQLLDFFRLDMDKLHLPKIVRSSDPEAYGKLGNGRLAGVPITGCLGDQSAALVGQKGFSPGRAKNTYGTGCFLLYHVGSKPVISTHGLLSTVAYDFDGTPQYALEGSIAVAGSSIKFLQNNFGFIGSSSEISGLAETVEDNGGCTFVTAFSGLFAPYWMDDARGTICKFPPCGRIRREADIPFGSWHHSIYPKGSRGESNSRSNLLPNQSHSQRHGKGQRTCAGRTRGGWWNDKLRFMHAGPCLLYASSISKLLTHRTLDAS